MKILVVAPYEYNTSSPQRFRIEQWLPYLESRGITWALSPFMTPGLRKVLYSRGRILRKSWEMGAAIVRRIVAARSVGAWDLIYLVREASLGGPAIAERVMAREKIPILYDFDDAIFHRYVSPFNSYLSYLKFPGKTATLCSIASHVIVGNRHLYDYAVRYNRNVSIVPTTIDTTKYSPIEKTPRDGPVVIGWSGSESSTQYLPMLYPVLQALSRRYPVIFLAVGARQFTIPGVKTEIKDWNPETEIANLSRMDIGIMPLPDEKWARGKCGLKLLQYMALGITAVASPVGVNSEIIQNGVNGFLASDRIEWEETLSRLIEDRGLRRRIGMAGRRTVEEKYSASRWAGEVYNILNSVKEERT